MTRPPSIRTPRGIAPLTAAERRILLGQARGALVARLYGRAFHPEIAAGALQAPGATFVTLRRRTGELRGCCGEIEPCRPLAESVRKMVIAAALTDPRFPRVHPSEVDDLSIEITRLGPLRPVRPGELEIGRHGVVICRAERRGVLLPQVAPTLGWGRAELLAGVCRKAGLQGEAWEAPGVELFSFEAESWGEEPTEG